MSTDTDSALILRLSRENEVLRAQVAGYQADLITIGALTSETIGPPDLQAGPAGTVVDRVDEALALIRAFPLDLNDTDHKLPGLLWKVTTPTSIEAIEDYVVAESRERVAARIKRDDPMPPCPGYEPRIEQVPFWLGGIHWAR